jgi:hypothetical protein
MRRVCTSRFDEGVREEEVVVVARTERVCERDGGERTCVREVGGDFHSRVAMG